MGTSFSALIFASISSQTSALFWNRTLRMDKHTAGLAPTQTGVTARSKPPKTVVTPGQR